MARLVGTRLPDLDLEAHDGSWVNLARLSGVTVVFCYPFTGRPGHPNPPGWDNIPGAHGSTPQALAFSKLYREFQTLHAKLFGLSFLSTDWQKDFAVRNVLPFLLLSDTSREFSKALQLETFVAGATHYLSRRCFIIENGFIRHDLFPVEHPERSAADVLAMLRP